MAIKHAAGKQVQINHTAKKSNDTVPVTVSIPAWMDSLAVENNLNLSDILQNALMLDLGVKKAK